MSEPIHQPITNRGLAQALQELRMNRLASRLPAIVEQHQQEILTEWVRLQLESGAWRAGRLQESQLREESQRLLGLPVSTIQNGIQFDARSSRWAEIREFLSELSRSRATQGFAVPGRDVRVLAQAADLHPPAHRPDQRAGSAGRRACGKRHVAYGQSGLYTTEVYRQAREAGRPSAGRADRTVDQSLSCGQASWRCR